MRWLLMFAFFAASANAAREFVIWDDPLPARQVEGAVLDPAGDPVPRVTVSDCTPEWRAVLRTTVTDDKGRFHFSRQSGKNLYHLRFDHPLLNPLGLKLELHRTAPKREIIARPEIGG